MDWIPTIVVALASGLAFLAYHNPKSFPRLYRTLMSGVVTLFITVLAYHFGGLIYSIGRLPEAAPDQFYVTVVGDLNESLAGFAKTVTYTVPVVLYLVILRLLPEFKDKREGGGGT